MTDDTKNVDIDTDLDAFEDEFFQREKPAEKEAVEEDEPEVDDLGDDDDSPAPDEDEDEEPEDDEDEDSDEEEEEEPQPKAKKPNRVQERINELTAGRREAERELAAMRKEFAEFKASVEKGNPLAQEQEKPMRDRLPDEAPNPDALNDKGEPIYPLGEFDPTYIRDLTKFTIAEETKLAKEQAAREAEQAKVEQAKQELVSEWTEKVAAAEERIPDLRENMLVLESTFSDIEPNLGEYIASTIMMSDNGPDIMYYLSQNIGEARKIVASGPAAATLAIGRLDAKFTKSTEQEKPKSNVSAKVSNAPEPPEDRLRGRGGRFTVAPDTDDLDAFEREYFKK